MARSHDPPYPPRRPLAGADTIPGQLPSDLPPPPTAGLPPPPSTRTAAAAVHRTSQRHLLAGVPTIVGLHPAPLAPPVSREAPSSPKAPLLPAPLLVLDDRSKPEEHVPTPRDPDRASLAPAAPVSRAEPAPAQVQAEPAVARAEPVQVKAEPIAGKGEAGAAGARPSSSSQRVTPGKGAFARRVSSTPPAPAPPGRYETVKAIGTGTLGVVDLVRDNDLARTVARKRLKPEWRQGETLLRFVDEIKLLGQLEHPGIAPIHDVGIDEEGYFLVMKHVEGDTLAQVIARLRAGDPEAVARYTHGERAAIFAQVLDAIGFAHERGVIHRDLRPESVVIGRHGEVTIRDWGLARRAAPTGAAPVADAAPAPASVHGLPATERSPLLRDSLLPPVVLIDESGEPRPGADALPGAPAYMSPEQARGRLDLIDARSDLYSLAAVFHELMTLRPYLTPRSTPEQTRAAIVHGDPPSAAAVHRHGVPPEYGFFLQRGLAKDPSARFQSADEMARALRAIRDGRAAVQSASTGLKAAGRGWLTLVDRRPAAAVAAAALVGGCALYGAHGLVLRLLGLLAP